MDHVCTCLGIFWFRWSWFWHFFCCSLSFSVGFWDGCVWIWCWVVLRIFSMCFVWLIVFDVHVNVPVEGHILFFFHHTNALLQIYFAFRWDHLCFFDVLQASSQFSRKLIVRNTIFGLHYLVRFLGFWNLE